MASLPADVPKSDQPISGKPVSGKWVSPEPLSAREIDAEQMRARVAWLYFIGGLTQQKIAARLGLTRLRVNKILGQVRSDGSVMVDIRLPMAGCVALEHALVDRFQLEEACVVPSVSDNGEQQRVIGDAAGSMLDRMLDKKSGIGIGVGWGRTLTAGMRRIATRGMQDSWVASVMGGLTIGSGSSTFEVATGYARALSADCYYFAAPLYLPTRESREILLSHAGIRDSMQRARSAQIVLLSCGDMTTRSQLIETPTIVENQESLIAAGAVGDLLGVFLDKDGAPIDHPLNERVLALSPEELKSVPCSILASGGMHKVAILGAILKAGFTKRLATDENCATALLQL